ncbi:hypothetical protein KP509_22G064800 [Ceratopteris richardii]|uniref:Protein kinase domain-containing protein n=1 Tax=Ceratopteris richardii TaxID=49495 RepID=A0A8T2S706_CERRI|nr:hypothetical protein KP509_22G064800 [Ceratopteris richardii]
MSLNMKSLTQALAKTAAVIEQTVQSTVQEVTGPKALQDYELHEQLGSGGHGLAWKLYAAKPRNKSMAYNQDVCVWVLDKKSLTESRQRIGLSKAAEDAFLDVIRADAMQLVKLRHPGVVHVIQGLEENKTAMTLVTESIFASIANVVGHLDNISNFPKGLKGLELGQLEIKHGLLQLADSLSFLHNNARLIHRALSPEVVFITASGAWKLGGFGFSVNADQATSDLGGGQTFHYPEYDSDDLILPLQPPLNYTAPELTRSGASFTRASSDIFSLGCLAFHLLARRPLIDCKNNLRTYTSKVTYLQSEDFSEVPPEMVQDLRHMLSIDELSRPSAYDFTGSPYFRDDTRLRAIRFLDHMLERENMQKTEFLKALSTMWTSFDARVLRYKVLPPLCAELRNIVMQPMVLPMILTIAESQDKADFEAFTFPALAPVLSSATGDSLLLLVKHAGLLISKVSVEQLGATVVPMLARAYDDSDARMQEEVLRRTLPLAKQLDFQVVRQTILPRLHNLALKTTVAAVRVNALLCLGEFVHRLDKPSVLEILQTLRRCTAVDHSAPTLMCTLSVANSVYKQYGSEFAVEHLVPLLAPSLVAQQLNLQQFAKYMLFIKEVLRKMEEKRGVTLNETSSLTSLAASSYGSEGMKTSENGFGSYSAGKIRNPWEMDDWASITKAGSASVMSAKPPSTENLPALSRNVHNTVATSVENPTGGYKGGALSSSFEWPPPVNTGSREAPSVLQTSSSFYSNTQTVGVGSTEGLGPTGQRTNTGVLENFDPFVDWPPKSSSTSTGPKWSSLDETSLTNSLFNNARGNKNERQSHNNELNIGAFLASSGSAQSESQPPRKLAPPPSGLGKGRGRNPIRPIGSPKTSTSTSSNQPPLLDLI